MDSIRSFCSSAFSIVFFGPVFTIYFILSNVAASIALEPKILADTQVSQLTETSVKLTPNVIDPVRTSDPPSQSEAPEVSAQGSVVETQSILEQLQYVAHLLRVVEEVQNVAQVEEAQNVAQIEEAQNVALVEEYLSAQAILAEKDLYKVVEEDEGKHLNLLRTILAETPLPERLKSLREDVIDSNNKWVLLMVDDSKDTFDLAIKQFARAEENDLKKQIFVRYVNSQNQAEGVDIGGLKREYFSKVVQVIANNMFNNQNGDMYFSTNELNQVDETVMYAVGAILAKALLEKVQVPISLNVIVYKLLCGFDLKFEDLAQLRPEMYNLLISDGGLQYYIDEQATFVPLVDNIIYRDGNEAWKLKTERPSTDVVDGSNYREWRNLQANFFLLESVKKSMTYFLQGFYNVCPRESLVAHLSPGELKMLLEGSTVSTESVARVCKYIASGAGGQDRETWLMEILHSFTAEEAVDFLFLVTGLRRIPMDATEVYSVIERTTMSLDSLPLVSTCSCSLSIPRYKSKQVMRSKLLQTMRECQGYQRL